MLTSVLEKLLGAPPENYEIIIYLINLGFVWFVLEEIWYTIKDILFLKGR